MEPCRIVVIIKNVVAAATRCAPARSAEATHVLVPQADVFAGIVDFFDQHGMVLARTRVSVAVTVGVVARRPGVGAVTQ